MTSDNEDKLIVPQFGSFKRKEAVKPHSELARESKRSKKSESSLSSRRADDDPRPRHHSRERHRHRSHRSTTDQRDRCREDPTSKTSSAVVPNQSGDFVIDTKGDPLIRKYGTIDKAQVPSYRRYGRGKVLGTEGRLFMYYEGSKELFGLRMPGDGPPRLRGREGLRSKRSLAHSHPVQLRPRRATSPGDDSDGFISMESSKKFQKRLQSDASSDEEQPSYRSIEGKAKANNDVDESEDDESDSSIELQDEELGNPLKWKSIQLSRQVKEHPGDIDAWLELVDHQNDLMRESHPDGSFSDNEAHSYAEIKVSMLESALGNATDTSDRERILVRLMREGPKIWTTKATAKRWADLESHSLSYELWKARLEFAMTSIATFQYNETKQMFTDRMKLILREATAEKMRSAFEEAIDIFLHASRFLQDCGYRELAVASWQALLELTFFRPLPADDSQVIPESFNDFWECEVPRIGEVGAQGWKHFVQSSGSDDPPEPVIQAPADVASSRDAYKAWGNIEQASAEAAKLAARSMDDGTEEDPYRIVTYADVEPLLFVIPSSLVKDISPLLIDCFMLFCGLPPVFRADRQVEAAYVDQFISKETIAVPHSEVIYAKDGSEDSSKKKPWLYRDSVHGLASWDNMFLKDKWFESLAASKQQCFVDKSWTLHTVDQLVHSAGISRLAETSLGLCFTQQPSSIKRHAKALLKRYANQPQLYSGYGLAEVANDNAKVGNNVLQSAMASVKVAAGIQGLSLFLSAAWIELELGNISLSAVRICSAENNDLRGANAGQHASSTHVLKSTQSLASQINTALYEGRHREAVVAAECSILLHYLTGEGGTEPISTQQGNISAAMQLVWKIINDYQDRGYGKTTSLEAILQFVTHLLYVHSSKG